MTEEEKATKKRVRSTNYTMEEKAALINIITKYKDIIESKKTDKVSWKDKSDTWERIGNEFNSISPSGTYRIIDSLRKFYENLKKDTRKNAAQEKMELFKTGGGRPAHKIVDPMHESILTLMNTKTVTGFNNRFDSDALNTLSDTTNLLSNADNILNDNVIDSMTNDAVYINDSNQSNVNAEEYTTYEALDDDTEETTGTTQSIHINANTYAPCKEITIKSKKAISKWNTYTPGKLKTPKHTSLKVTNALENKENETNLVGTTTRQRRPSTTVLHSSHISKQYSDLAEIKMELATLQLLALKEEMAAKKKQNEMEFEMKKKCLELDIQLKQAQLRKLQSSLLQ